MATRNVAVVFALFSTLMVPASSLQTISGTAESKNFPVRKVIDLLKHMQEELTQDAANDQALMDKMACWCTTNRKEKTESIAASKKQIQQLKEGQASGAAAAQANTKTIKKLNEELARDQTALDEATSIRNKEFQSFSKEQQDTIENIKALEAAITILKKHQSFLQRSVPEVKEMARIISNAMVRHADSVASLLTMPERNTATAFLQSLMGGDYASPTFRTKYNNQSGEIFGILNAMLDNFKSTLSAAEKDEQAAQAAYSELKAAKEAEIKTAQETRRKLHEKLTAADLAVVEQKEAREETQATLAADQKFLQDLEATCGLTEEEHKRRIANRDLEVQAVAKAIEILDSDVAHDSFSKSFNPSLLQTSMELQAEVRTEASRLLAKVARKQQNPRLAALAVEIRLDSFTKVREAIQDMIVQLEKQKADEIHHKDWCNRGLNKNQAETETAHRAHGEANRTIDSLNTTLLETKAEMKALHEAVEEMTTAIKRAGENREKENAAFQVEVREQKDAQVILKKAQQVLREVYDAPQHPGNAQFVQEDPVGVAAPAGFEEYSQNADSSKVLTMLQKIIGEAQAEEAELHRDEIEAQNSYEIWVKDTNDDIAENMRLLVVKKQFAAETSKRLSSQVEDRAQIREDEANLMAELADMRKSCDYILKNFDIRQQARDEEVEALNGALRVLKGAVHEA